MSDDGQFLLIVVVVAIPGDEFEPSVEVLDDGRAAVDPVATVDVGEAVRFADHGTVNVAADDPVQPALARGTQRSVLEVEDELQRTLHPALGVAGERPVAGHAEAATDQREDSVQPHQHVVHHVAEDGDPAVMAGDLVKLVAMQEQEAAPVGQRMHVLADDANVTEGDAEVVAQRFVVISGDENDPLAVPRPPQDLLHKSVLGFGPYDVAAHRPEIDDVADEEDVLRRVAAHEAKQTIGLAGTRAKVDVGEEDRADFLHGPNAARRSLRREDIPITFSCPPAPVIDRIISLEWPAINKRIQREEQHDSGRTQTGCGRGRARVRG